MKKLYCYLFLPVFVVVFFTSCVTKDAYYSGQEPLKKNSGLALASAIANKEIGSHLFVLIDIVNTQTNEELTLENRVCQVKKRDVGLLAKAFISKERSKDIIQTPKGCGNIITGELTSGQYELKQIKIFSQDISSGMLASKIRYIPKAKHFFTIKPSEVTYIGNVDIFISRMLMSSHISDGTIEMNDRFELSKEIMKKHFHRLKKTKVTNSTIRLEAKNI